MCTTECNVYDGTRRSATNRQSPRASPGLGGHASDSADCWPPHGPQTRGLMPQIIFIVMKSFLYKTLLLEIMNTYEMIADRPYINCSIHYFIELTRQPVIPAGQTLDTELGTWIQIIITPLRTGGWIRAWGIQQDPQPAGLRTHFVWNVHLSAASRRRPYCPIYTVEHSEMTSLSC